MEGRRKRSAFTADKSKRSVVRSPEALADAERADELDASGTVGHETPEQVQNS